MQVTEVMAQMGLLTWQSIYVGWQHRWISKNELIKFVVNWLSYYHEEHNKALLELATAEPYSDCQIDTLLFKYLDTSHSLLNESDIQIEIDKWRLAFLVELACCKIDDEEKLDRLENLYAEFSYPEDMKACSRYYIPPEFDNEIILGRNVGSPLVAMDELIRELKAKYSLI